MPERITKQLLRVLETFMDDQSAEWYGLDLIDATRLQSGTLYPLLHRLVADGWLIKTREVASDSGGPTRVLYRITGQGARAAAELLETRAPQRSPSPTLRPGVQPA